MYLGSGLTVVVMVLGSAPTIVLDISPAVVPVLGSLCSTWSPG